MHEFNQSLKYDRRMHSADIRGSIAYAKGLKRCGILTQEEEDKLVKGLQDVGKEWINNAVREGRYIMKNRYAQIPRLVCCSGR
jgi:argininosuccinate lyase